MSQNFTITPGIEQRLASWNEHLRKQKQEAAGLRPCITLSREFGCQAYPVAEALQNLFNRILSLTVTFQCRIVWQVMHIK